MRIKCLFFAGAKDIVGTNELQLELGPDSTSEQLSTQLLSSFPDLQDIWESCIFAVNLTYIDSPVPLKDGDEVAIIPPISGG